MFVDVWITLPSQIRIDHGCPRGSAIWDVNLWMSTLHFQLSSLIGVYGNHPDDIWDGVCLCLCPPYVWYAWIFLDMFVPCVANTITTSTWIIVDTKDWSLTYLRKTFSLIIDDTSCKFTLGIKLCKTYLLTIDVTSTFGAYTSSWWLNLSS